MSARALAVIDTNVALDLLVFADPRCEALRDALADGRMRWIASAAMRDELTLVLARGFGGRWPVDRGRVLAAWDGWAQVVVEPTACGLRCSDRDDQKFIDLALMHRPCWLLTRDRALLHLAKRAGQCDVDVRSPGPWLAEGLCGT